MKQSNSKNRVIRKIAACALLTAATCCTALGVHFMSAVTAENGVTLVCDSDVFTTTANYKYLDYAYVNEATLTDAEKEMTGTLVKANATGTGVEGASFSVQETQTDDFSMDFRVFSQTSYKHNGIGWETHWGNWAAVNSDDYNPFLDLKEVDIVFTSVAEPSKTFTLHMRGGVTFNANMAGAYVSVNGVSTIGTDTYSVKPLYGTSFSNYGSDKNGGEAATRYNSIGFDLSTGAITAKSYNSSLSAETVTTVYTLTADDGLASYASGYTVSVRYADVTENDVTGNELAAAFATAQANAGIDTSRTDTTFATISATVNGNTFNERYKEYNATLGKYNGSLCYDEGVGTAYEREAQMLVYSVNGQSVSVVDNGKTDVKASSLITVDDKLTATDNQTNALDNKNGLLISSEGKASGDTAEGASFSFNDTMNGAFDMDFRVTSEKTYASKVTTWGAHGLANNNSYFSDIANPYADVREVAFTFTSATDSSKAFTVYLSSGFLAPTNTAGTYFTYYPYYVSARVEINGDSYKYYDADGVERGGYGLAYNDYQAGLYEYQYNYTSLWNTSFSNYAVTKSGDWAYPTPHASNIYFDPATMKVYASGADMSGGLYTDRSATKDYLVRDLTNNDAVDWGKNVYWKQVWKTLSPEDFAGGYTVSVQFTSVTSDETVAQASTAETDIPELLYDHTNGYVAFDEAYARNINMTIYSLNGTSFGTTGSKLADSEAPNLDAPKNMTAFVENDLTPLYYDVMDGDTIPEAGYGKVYVSTDDKASWTEVTVNSEGKYLYTPSVAVGTYYVKYEGFADSNGNAAETQEYAVAGVYSGFNMVNGAGIRLDTSNAGLRFTATMDKSVYEGLAAAGISDVKLFFAITVTYDKDGVETTKTLNKEVSADNVYENGTVMQITAAVTGITSDMYDYEWSAKAYITFTKDGESGTLYAKADDNVRTVRNVALAGLVDHADDTYGVEYSEEHLAILNTLAGLA